MDDDIQCIGPLQGLRVIELGSIIAGPFAGRLLADLGADVIKIESPGKPDPLREWGTVAYKDVYLMWTVLARNKRCITLNLASDEGRAMALELIAKADVVIENFRPGTLEKWNLGFEAMAEVNPGIVLARVSGFGQTGPYAPRPGFASVAEAMSGLRAVNGNPGENPPRVGVSLGDSLAGMFATQGILAALYHRDRTGTGQVVDIALTESCLALLESMIPEYDRTGHIRRASGTRLDGIAPSNIYDTADGSKVIIAANNDALFDRLCKAMNRPELAHDERFVTHVARGRHQDEIDAIVAEWVLGHTRDEIVTRLVEADVVVGPLNTIDDVVSDPHFRDREMLVDHWDERIGENVLGPGVVPKFSKTPGTVRWAGRPTPGSDNDDVFGTVLGLSAPQIAELQRQGVV